MTIHTTGKMKDEWLNRLHDRMADFETEAAGVEWEDIEDRIFPEHTVTPSGKRRMVVWIRRAVSTAAAVAVVVGATYLLLPPTDRHPAQSQLESSRHLASSLPDVADQKTELMAEQRPAARQTVSAVVIPVERSLPPTESVITVAEVVSSSHETSSETSSETSPAATDKESTSTRKITRRNLAAVHPQPTRRQLGVGVYTSAEAGYSSLQRTMGGSVSPSVGPDNAVWEDSPMLGIMLYNRGRETVRDVKHRLPVRLGVSLSYAFSPKWSIESGIVYTRLSSDIREGSDSHYCHGGQTLHYVGVPVGVRYALVSRRKLEVYGSAEVTLEKCVDGSVETSYVIAGHAEQTSREEAASRPWQLSAGLSAGLQFNVSPGVGIYAEPGLSYHFDDRSSLETVFKERPLGFNLHLGVRLKVNR